MSGLRGRVDRPPFGAGRPRPDLRLRLWLILLGLAMASFAMAATSPIGRWLTQDRGGVIEIFACGQALCGRITGLGEPGRAAGNIPTDHAGKPKCGRVILRDAVEGEV